MGKRLIIIGAAIFAALFLFSSIMLFSEYQDQKQSARVFKQVTELVEKDFTESEKYSIIAKAVIRAANENL